MSETFSKILEVGILSSWELSDIFTPIFRHFYARVNFPTFFHSRNEKKLEILKTFPTFLRVTSKKTTKNNTTKVKHQ